MPFSRSLSYLFPFAWTCSPLANLCLYPVRVEVAASGKPMSGKMQSVRNISYRLNCILLSARLFIFRTDFGQRQITSDEGDSDLGPLVRFPYRRQLVCHRASSHFGSSEQPSIRRIWNCP